MWRLSSSFSSSFLDGRNAAPQHEEPSHRSINTCTSIECGSVLSAISRAEEERQRKVHEGIFYVLNSERARCLNEWNGIGQRRMQSGQQYRCCFGMRPWGTGVTFGNLEHGTGLGCF